MTLAEEDYVAIISGQDWLRRLLYAGAKIGSLGLGVALIVIGGLRLTRALRYGVINSIRLPSETFDIRENPRRYWALFWFHLLFTAAAVTYVVMTVWDYFIAPR